MDVALVVGKIMFTNGGLTNAPGPWLILDDQMFGHSSVRPDQEKESGLQNLREALVFRFPELSESDRLYLEDYSKFIQNYKSQRLQDTNML